MIAPFPTPFIIDGTRYHMDELIAEVRAAEGTIEDVIASMLEPPDDLELHAYITGLATLAGLAIHELARRPTV